MVDHQSKGLPLTKAEPGLPVASKTLHSSITMRSLTARLLFGCHLLDKPENRCIRNQASQGATTQSPYLSYISKI
jgi:hypothetical protein